MINFNKNNLDNSSSPYLLQHKDNPIHWQEFSKDVVEYAKINNKLLLISVGYSSCHWCHVMASESFSDNLVAEFLNNNFVCIKVDKELRTDIDSYLMSYMVKTQGHGGWPLNVILTPNFKPFIAFTYLPVNEKMGLPPIIEVLKFSLDVYSNNKDSIKEFNIDDLTNEAFNEKDIISSISSCYDDLNGGFSIEPKFPQYNTLLFLLYYYSVNNDSKTKLMIEHSLDMISIRGLHDHLQGGFFRYCVDSSWTIPHFEKMLYDQAMLLWVFSLAYKLFNKIEYKIVCDKILKCLEESFYSDNLYFSSIDADTNHEEGLTYLWSIDEIKNILSDEEFNVFKEVYNIEENFDNKIHLIKKKNVFLNQIENKLLDFRKSKPQPFIDKKIITSWNCLLGIAFLINHRCTDNINSQNQALSLFKSLLDKHFINNKLIHSSFNNQLQNTEFLEDYASFLLFATFIYEETNEYKNLISGLYDKIAPFNVNNRWFENINSDFKNIPANFFDYPYPSSVSLAEMAVLRSKIILNKEYSNYEFKTPINYDFFNIISLISNGYFHMIHSKNFIDWNKLPVNYIINYSGKFQDCFKNSCKEFDNIDELIKNIKN